MCVPTSPISIWFRSLWGHFRGAFQHVLPSTGRSDGPTPGFALAIVSEPQFTSPAAAMSSGSAFPSVWCRSHRHAPDREESPRLSRCWSSHLHDPHAAELRAHTSTDPHSGPGASPPSAQVLGRGVDELVSGALRAAKGRDSAS